MSTFDRSPKSYKINSKNAIKIFKTLRLNNTYHKSYDSLKELYTKLIGVLDSKATDDCKIKTINNILRTNKVNQKLFGGYELMAFSFSKKKRAEFLSKPEEFFSFLNNLNYNDLNILRSKEIFMMSLFLTYIGAKPSCLIDKEMVPILMKYSNSMFSGYQHIDSIHYKAHTLFYKPETLLKVTNNNKDLFGSIQNSNQLKEFLENNPICIHNSDAIHENTIDFLYNKARVGVLLGIPKNEAIHFASKEKILFDYEKYLSTANSCNYNEVDDEYFEDNIDPTDKNTYQSFKSKNINKLKAYMPYEVQKKSKNIIDELAGRIVLDFSSGRIRSDIKINLYTGYSHRNRLYDASIKKILSNTNYFEKIKNLGF